MAKNSIIGNAMDILNSSKKEKWKEAVAQPYFANLIQAGLYEEQLVTKIGLSKITEKIH